ncbi:hypothetical protein [Thalassobacillus pellis]|uniref:hypothetical protein n=1 Tax=Thalassobacillus pellis TaxID=748008 RepID=UPI00195F8D75|nr:hypothetical protein [Thalassobacillus pellis]MBM7553778.1 hypothetical protein [Thalassobacillus pellis]
MKMFNSYKKVAVDLSWVQLVWTAWFLAIVFLIYFLFRFIGGEVTINSQNLDTHSFLTFAYHPSKIFMLVIGIISVSGFLTFFAKQGVTRKNYFYGAAISSCVVSIIIMVAAVLITAIEQFINPADATVLFLGPESTMLSSVLTFTLNIQVYFMAGWIIGAGFYRLGGFGGILYIVLAIIFIAVSDDILWESEMKTPVKMLLNIDVMWKPPLAFSTIGSVVLISAMLVIVRFTTKRVRIKMK